MFLPYHLMTAVLNSMRLFLNNFYTTVIDCVLRQTQVEIPIICIKLMPNAKLFPIL